MLGGGHGGGGGGRGGVSGISATLFAAVAVVINMRSTYVVIEL